MTIAWMKLKHTYIYCYAISDYGVAWLRISTANWFILPYVFRSMCRERLASVALCKFRSPCTRAGSRFRRPACRLVHNRRTAVDIGIQRRTLRQVAAAGICSLRCFAARPADIPLVLCYMYKGNNQLRLH